MKCVAVVLSLASLAAAAALDGRGECHGNNCNRAVTGTRPGLLPFPSRSADCSSFLSGYTVTPPAVTVTVTVEADDYEDDDEYTEEPAPTPTPTQGPAKRDGWLAWIDGREVVQPRANGGGGANRDGIPDYADNCVDAAEYATACSCLGVTSGAGVTAPTPTVTVTETVDWCDGF
ncbi:hypothetical protein VTK26DRAFT_6354 [Humicola hyalothermophila]